MLDLLIIQHESDTPPGSTLEWADQRSLNFQIWKIYEGSQAPVEADQVGAVLICGGSMDTWEEQKYPWLKIEKNYIQQCLQLQKPLFGLCLGSQLLAEALGGKVYSMNKWEAGFVPVQLLEEDHRELEVFHWHQFTFDLPPGAQLIATHEFCPNQAFRHGPNIVATQFHPEATKTWIAECADLATSRSYAGRVQSKQEILDCLPKQPLQQAWFFKQLDTWYSTVNGSP